MADLKASVACRGYAKASITKLKNAMDAEDFSKTRSLEKLKATRLRLDNVFADYNKYCMQVQGLDPSDTEDPGFIEEMFLDLTATLSKVINELSISATNTSSTTATTSTSKIKLPNVVIPTFTGKYTDYYAFNNIFNAMIDSDLSLSPVQKLYYLKGFLSEEPLAIINNLPLHDDSYAEALKLLRERYDNKSKIINEHIHTLLDLPSITRSTTANLRNFISDVKQHLAALKNLEEPVDSWDSMIVCILSRKLDTFTARAFQMERDNKSSPTIKEFLDYLQRRALALECTDFTPQKHQQQRLTSHAVAVQSAPATCIYCKSAHKLFQCSNFKMASPKKRLEFASANKICKICLSTHKRKCKFHFRCAECKQEHNTLLHDNELQHASPSVTLLSSASQGQVLLPTARIKLISQSGSTIYARALLDSASQASFVTQKLAELLGVTQNKTSTTITGISNIKQSVEHCVNLEVHSIVYPFKINVDCYVVPKITTKLPQSIVNISDLTIPPNCKLADDTFHTPGDVHLLLGADVFFQILLPQPEAQPSQSNAATSAEQHYKHPSLLHTSLGYIVAGCSSSEANSSNKVVSLFCQECDSSLNDTLSAFWKSEQVPEIFPEKLPEHDYCEKLFDETTKLEGNKFQVSMPLKVPLEQVNSELGESFHLAYERFINLEKRLHKNTTLFHAYKKFIDEYIQLNHAEVCNINSYNMSKDPVYFLPHHAVIKENAQTTKLRAVFDGSMPTNKKISLNNLLLNGPVVQKDLFEILIAFRLERYFFICDIRMMFRCIELDPTQRSLQNILWRDSPDHDIKCIQLNTVTYGLKSSSYLATRCLIELARRYRDKFPLASSILENNTYVDDVLANNNSEQMLVEMQSQLVQLLALGGFQLHKWASNCNSVLKNVQNDTHNEVTEVILNKQNMCLKALGVSFDIQNDTFKSTCPEPYLSQNDTKRDILSFISKFHDPLGLVGPIFVRAKVIMQSLWAANIDWDSAPPDEIRQRWLEFSRNLSQMKPLSMSRCVKPADAISCELIGFADGSSVAHGCCLYLRSIDSQGKVHVHLLCSKSRINPLKKELTIPRVELNAAMLLAKLTRKIHDTIHNTLQVNETYLFSDSQIVLAWLKTDAAKLQTYVANRVRAIGELLHSCHWRYVNTGDNPSDFLSRGLQPQELENNKMWWHGPSFLQDKNYQFSSKSEIPTQLPELKIKEVLNCAATTINDFNLIDKLKEFSSINKMTRVLAYVFRFCQSNAVREKGFLKSVELNKALMYIVKHEQEQFYYNDIKSLKNQGNVSGNLKPLAPFLDSSNVMRVGGRLQNASIPYASQHPAILPKGSSITELIIRDEHIKLMHAGQKLLLTSLRQRFWIVDGLRTIKKVIYKCVICFRMKAVATTQLMGSLPAPRVNACRPFQRVGMDFAGPVSVKNSRIRKPVIGKGYILVFVCFVTKAIHLELASDLTTETFLACFRRFIARRNLPSDVHCDNASTFKGARNQLDELYRLMASKSHQHQVQSFASSRGINFHFIPSYSPIFGALWESSVKSVKHHLKHVVAKALLTYEQLNTVLTEIEGILNSRPITAISADPTDFTYLSPGHFLTGAALNTYPEHDVKDKPVNLLRYWYITVNMKQNFWRYWSKQYLCLLQNRPKWRDAKPNVQIGSLVILCSDNTAPLHWPMARVTKLFPGKDNFVRTVEVKTPNGHTHNRCVSKICVLPVDV